MFRPMRRSAQELTREECEEILRRCPMGVLAVTGDEGYPYAVPVNPVYENGTIYFHCAREGHKLDAIRRDSRVSFCVVDQDTVIPEERTTAYVSVIAFGRARLLEDEAEMRHVCDLIGRKFCPDHLEACRAETEETLAARRLGVVAVTVEHLTGKCGKAVLQARRGKQAP